MNPQPSPSFVPLSAAPASAEKREFRVAVLSSNGADSPAGNGDKKPAFQSLESTRPTSLGGAERKPCEPRVTVQRDGGRVTHLRIQCACGQIMDLACMYDETPPAP